MDTNELPRVTLVRKSIATSHFYLLLSSSFSTNNVWSPKISHFNLFGTDVLLYFFIYAWNYVKTFKYIDWLVYKYYKYF